MAEVFNEYLVKLGWDIDKGSFNNAQSFVGTFAKTVGNVAKNLAENIASSSVYSAKSIGEGIASIAKFVNGVAQADNATAEFARKMWTTKENALSFNNALEAMGKTMDDVFYMTPEEFNYLNELRDLGKSIQAPKELDTMLQKVRGINQEVNKLKVMLSYGKQWVSYYLLKYMGTDIDTIRQKLSDFNNWIRNNIPKIASIIAKPLYTIYRYGKVIFNLIESLASSLKKLWDSMSAGQRGIVKFGAGFLALLKSGPIGLFIAAILFIIELLDDIQTWKRGGKSLFGDVYDSIFGGENKNFSGIAGTIQRFVNLKDDLLEILDHIKQIGINLGLWGDEVDGVTIAIDMLNAALNTVWFICKSILEVINFILSGIQAMTGGVYDLDQNNPWRLNDEAQYRYIYQMSGGNMPDYQTWLASQGVGGNTNTTNNNTQNITANIEVKDSGNPKQTGNAVADSIVRIRGQYGAFY